MVDNGTYGYEQALSEDDVRSGTATKPLVMMRYEGNKNGRFVILVFGTDASDGSIVNRVSCQAPCAFAKSETLAGDTVVKSETIPVKPNAIIGGMLEDAVSGQLVPYGQGANGGHINVPPQASAMSSPLTPQASPSVAPAGAGASQPSAGGGGQTYQTSFDCSKAKSIPEYLICHDPDLAAADRDLAVTYQKANGAVSDKAALFDRARKQWNFRERNCRDKACLLSWYQYESDTFNTIAQTGDVNAQVEQRQ